MQAALSLDPVVHLPAERVVARRVPDCELSIVMPCLNEAETLATCIRKARRFLDEHEVAGEIVVADNGSTDGSQTIAVAHGARVVHVPERGYGAALRAGIAAARGRYVVMGDADDSYDFSELTRFLERLRAGDDLVMGNRFRGGIAPGAMPPLHRYLGNPVLSGIGRLFFGSPCGDFHCGLRGFSKRAIERLDLRTSGMEFASEMVVSATLHGLRIGEVPTTLSKDGRSRPPHLRSWRDGWRHLRFLLMYCPRWLFMVPGLALAVLGLAGMAATLPGPLTVAGVTFDVHTLLVAATAVLLGAQTISFGVLSKQYGIAQGWLPQDAKFSAWVEWASLERVLLTGGGLILAGLLALISTTVFWGASSFGALDYETTMRVVIPAVTAMAVGFQAMIGGFLSSILRMRRGTAFDRLA